MEIPKKTSTKGQGRKKGKKNRKWGRNKAKCQLYRERIGKPNGPGKPGRKT